MKPDHAMLALLRDKPEKGLEAMLSCYAGLVYAIVRGKLSGSGTMEDIEECVSDVFYELYKSAGSIDLAKGSIKAYLSVIARRRAIDAFRRITKTSAMTLHADETGGIPEPADASVEAEIINSECRAALLREITALGKPDSEIFILKYYLGMSTKSIADRLKLKENTVDKRVSRGLEKLRGLLGGMR